MGSSDEISAGGGERASSSGARSANHNDLNVLRRSERIRNICVMVRAGTYLIPTEKLAPILEKIISTMGEYKHRN